MNNQLKKNLLFGSLWGIAEATLGYVLHWVFFPISGMIMFPIGVFFMKQAQKETDNATSIIYVAVIASMIKCVNLLMPNPSIFKVINPALMILLQGGLVFVFLRESAQVTLAKTFVSSIGWRVVFLGVLLIEFRNVEQIYYFKGGLWRLINFLGVNSLINSVLIYAMNRYSFNRQWKLNPNIGFLAFVVAIGLQFVL